MELTSDEFFERLLLSYSDYFDIIRDTSYKDLSVAAEAAFHSFSEKYVLVKKAQLWAAEAHEYVFFVRTGHLDEETFRTYNDALLEEGLSRVEPKKDHMYTYVSVVFLAESIAPEVPKLSELLPTFALHALRGGSFDPKISCFSLTRSQIYRTISDRPNLTNNSVQRANPGVPTGFVQSDSI